MAADSDQIFFKKIEQFEGARSRLTFVDDTDAVGNLDELNWTPTKQTVRSLKMTNVVLTLDDTMERIPSYVFSTERIRSVKIGSEMYILPLQAKKARAPDLWTICPESDQSSSKRKQSMTLTPEKKANSLLRPDASVARSLSVYKEPSLNQKDRPIYEDPKKLQEVLKMRVRFFTRNNDELIACLDEFMADDGSVVNIMLTDVTIISPNGVKRKPVVNLKPNEIERMVLPQVYQGS